ncbi:hypothetical protein VW23_027795 [Devosia insulae DS-56]|uniref:PH domain-containing protein n=1 Tax=Devosia insulae DS-56 TaxID=1116389 RepID=A0A1E5XK20_9HYPH|nr:hypothetical protein [Devosia insulae]OEO28939.1 hypothetical protein VW23_027795 [Devosia insulae DS-56]
MTGEQTRIYLYDVVVLSSSNSGSPVGLVMQSYRRTFGANRFAAAAYFVLGIALAVSIFVPGVTDYVAHANFVGRLRMFNAWEAEHRLLVAYGVAGVGALSAVLSLRVLIDNTMVVVDGEGIEVRHQYWRDRALWRDFEAVTTTRFLGVKDTKILFRPGHDARGRKLTRKVRLPNRALGVDSKAVLLEVLHLTTAKAAPAPTEGMRLPRGPLLPRTQQAAVNSARWAMTRRARVLT